jgi:hypothetical protein
MPEKTELFETRVLDAIKEAQETMLKAVRSWVESLDRTLPEAARAAELRYADRLPEPRVVVGEFFDFAEALLKSQHDFALKLLDAAEPLTRSVEIKVGKRPTPVRSQRTHSAPGGRRQPAHQRGGAAVQTA